MKIEAIRPKLKCNASLSCLFEQYPCPWKSSNDTHKIFHAMFVAGGMSYELSDVHFHLTQVTDVHGLHLDVLFLKLSDVV